MSKSKEEQRYGSKYNRMMPMRTSVNTFITTYILYLLDKKGSMYGKEMIDEMTRRFKTSWSPSHGLVYPILNELEKEGIVTGKWKSGRTKRQIKEYSLTERGHHIFELEKRESEQAFNESMMMMELFMIDVYDTQMIDLTED